VTVIFILFYLFIDMGYFMKEQPSATRNSSLNFVKSHDMHHLVYLNSSVFLSVSPMPVSRSTAVERWSLAGELPLSCARPVADG